MNYSATFTANAFTWLSTQITSEMHSLPELHSNDAKQKKLL